MKKLLSILLIISVSANAQITLDKQLNLQRYLTASRDSGYLSAYHFIGLGTLASPIKPDSTKLKVNWANIIGLTGTPSSSTYLRGDGSWATAGGGSQTPWTSNIDGGGYNLSNIAKIEIGTTGTGVANFKAASGNTDLKFTDGSSTETWGASATTAGDFAFFHSGATPFKIARFATDNALYINGSGKTGFGTATVDSQVVINGGLRINNGAAQNGYVWTSTGTTGKATWQAPGGVSDGDKGDVNISSSGATYTVEGASGSFALSGVTTPSQYTSDQNDVDPGANTVLRVSSNSAARKITSISGGVAGRILVIENVGATDILLTHDDGSAGTAANRFDLDNHDIFISPKEAKTIKYDGALSRWVLIDQNDHVNAFRRQPFWSWDYMVAGVATANFSTTAIASGTAVYVNELVDHPGYMTITSSTNANSGSYSYYLASTTILSFKGGEIYECVFQPKVASNTNTTIRMGFMDCTNQNDAVDGAYIEIPAGSFAAVGKTSNNSTRTTSSTIATLAVNTWYRAEIQVNRAASSITFTIYDADGVSLGSQTNSANIPTGAGRAFGTGFIATNVGTSATLLAWLDYQACQLGANKALNR